MRMRWLSNYFLILFLFAVALMIVGCGGSGGKNNPVNIPPISSPSGDGGNENSNNIIPDTPQEVSIDRDKTEYGLFNDHFPTFLSHLFGGSFNTPSGKVNFPFAKVTVKNDSNISGYNLRLEVSIPNYSETAAEVFDIDPYQTREFDITPAFKQTLYSLNEEKACNIHLKLSDFQGRILDEWDKPITLLSKNDMVWGIMENDNQVDLTPFVTVFVTLHDEQVQQAIAAAKEKMFNNSLVGYQNMSRSDLEIYDSGSGGGNQGYEYDKFYASQGEKISIRIDSIDTLGNTTLDQTFRTLCGSL